MQIAWISKEFRAAPQLTERLDRLNIYNYRYITKCNEPFSCLTPPVTEGTAPSLSLFVTLKLPVPIYQFPSGHVYINSTTTVEYEFAYTWVRSVD